MDKASELIAAKTLTINKLLVLCPPGTIDPTPHLYDSTMYAMGALMTVGVLSHYMVRPIKALPLPTIATTATGPVSTVTSSSKIAVDVKTVLDAKKIN